MCCCSFVLPRVLLPPSLPPGAGVHGQIFPRSLKIFFFSWRKKVDLKYEEGRRRVEWQSPHPAFGTGVVLVSRRFIRRGISADVLTRTQRGFR